MERKYTMKEFKKMFEKAQMETLKQLEDERKEAENRLGKEQNSLGTIMFTMQNTMVTAMLHNNLFGEEDN